VCFEAAVLGDQPALLAPFAPLLPYSPCNPAKLIPEQAKILPAEVQGYNFGDHLAHFSQNLKLYHLMVAAAKGVTNFCIPNQFLIVSNNSSRAFPLIILLIVSRSCLQYAPEIS